MNNDWKQARLFKNKIKSFILEDEAIYIIDSGRTPPSKRFIIVHDDAYEQQTGNSELMSEEELLERYKINFDEESPIAFDEDELPYPNLFDNSLSEISVFAIPSYGELFTNALCYNFRSQEYSYYDKKPDSDIRLMDIKITSHATERLSLKQHRLLANYIVENNLCPDRIFIPRDDNGKNIKDNLYIVSKQASDGKILSIKPIIDSNND